MSIHNLISGILPRRSLELPFEDGWLKIPSLHIFKFCISSRTSIPTKTVQQFFEYSLSQIEKEARKTKDIEKTLLEILSTSLEKSGTSGTLRQQLGILNLQTFTQEQNWRSIFKALREEGNGFDEHIRFALVKYVQFLTARKDVLRTIYRDKKTARKKLDLVTHELEEKKKLLKKAKLTEANESLEDTSIIASAPFDENMPLDEALIDYSALSPLPKGEPLLLSLKNGKSMSLFLSKHKFTLTGGSTPTLRDESNNDSYILHTGKNSVGREPSCSISVNVQMRDISRRHLIVSILPENRIQLTDISTHGTMIPTLYMEN